MFLKDFIYYFLERGEGEGNERERNIDVREKVASCAPATGDLSCHPGTCLDWESNQRLFGLQDNAQPTEPHQSGCRCIFLKCRKQKKNETAKEQTHQKMGLWKPLVLRDSGYLRVPPLAP